MSLSCECLRIGARISGTCERCEREYEMEERIEELEERVKELEAEVEEAYSYAPWDPRKEK